MMTMRLMLKPLAVDESFIRFEPEMQTTIPRIGATSDQPLEMSAEYKRLAAMSLSSMLYYVLVGDREVADEFA
jgi:hypothetical protein